MRLSFFRFLFSLSVLLVVTSIIIPLFYGVTYPKPIGPILNSSVKKRYQDAIVKDNANLVLIGDSVLELSVDPEQLSKLTGENTVNIAIPGSASAIWYLIMKNNVAISSHKPQYVIIVFRDTILTVPEYRVNGKYFSLLSDFASSKDKLLIQKAFIQQMSLPEQWADQYLPIYGSRLQLRETLDYSIRYTLSSLVGCNQKCNDDANIAVFKDNNLESNLLVEAIATAESYLYTPAQLDFAAQLDNSFLPEIVSLAKENNIQLVLVRTKHLDDPTAVSESAALKGYIEDLKSFADKNNVIVLDFAHDDRLTSDLFMDTHHLTPAGAVIFTNMLAEALNPIFHK
jgi:hypothetical protein